jgi:hypothetical protein
MLRTRNPRAKTLDKLIHAANAMQCNEGIDEGTQNQSALNGVFSGNMGKFTDLSTTNSKHNAPDFFFLTSAPRRPAASKASINSFTGRDAASKAPILTDLSADEIAALGDTVPRVCGTPETAHEGRLAFAIHILAPGARPLQELPRVEVPAGGRRRAEPSSEVAAVAAVAAIAAGSEATTAENVDGDTTCTQMNRNNKGNRVWDDWGA